MYLEGDYLTTAQLAEKIQTSKPYVDHLIANGKVKAVTLSKWHRLIEMSAPITQQYVSRRTEILNRR